MFITLEGPEGAGKSTLAKSLAARLKDQGERVLLTREPGAGAVGTAIREILLHGEDLAAEAELFLFLADRAQHVKTMIRPHLEEGGIVLCDRYTDSTVVYQGYGRGLSLELLRDWNRFATKGLVPDLTLLLDLEAEKGLARLQNKDRLDSEPVEFHQRIRAGFLSEAKANPDRFVVINADQVADSVAEDAIQAVLTRQNAIRHPM